MEQRSSHRYPVSINVILNYRSLGLVCGRAHDIGMGGMFVRMGRIRLPVLASIEASLVLDSPVLKVPMTIDSVVVRSADEGVGLRFGELIPGVRQDLQQLLQQYPLPADI